MSTLDQLKPVQDGVVGAAINNQRPIANLDLDSNTKPWGQTHVFIPEWGPRITEYVCGFLFNMTGDYVVLIKRRASRAYRPNCWNGVGGKLEPGETPLQAMQREFKEEAGLEIKDWKQFGTLATDGGESIIHLFRSDQSTEMMYRVNTETDERVMPICIANLGGIERMPNLMWIISMAQSIRHCGVDMYHVIEEGRRRF